MPNYDVVHVIHRSIVFAFALLGMSCSTDDAPRAVCIRGRTNLCPCPASKAKGVQTCLPDGSGYGVCEGCENTTVEGGFAEVTEALGLNYRQGAPFDPPTNCITPLACQLNVITGGAAVGDFDNDGWPDLFVTTMIATPILFRNAGDGTFDDVTAKAGLQRFGTTNGAAWIDIDNDADLDLFVNTVGNDRYYLYLNDGKGHFEEVALAWGVAMDDGIVKAGTSISVGDYDRDGWLDLHVAEWGPKGSGDYGFLDPKLAGRTRLFRNRGKTQPGFFDDMTIAANATIDAKGFDGSYESVFSYSSAMVDFDGDDWPELAIAGDYRTSRFLWNDHGTFSNGTFNSGVAKETFGMGSAIGDLDGDGLLDWLVTSISNGPTCVHGLCNSGEYGNHLYRYLGNRQFSDANTEQLGVNAGFWAWGAEMFDYDNDGDLDLAVTNGTDYPFTTKGDFYTNDPMRFWRNDNGTMVQAAEQLGLMDKRSGKALMTLDYDHDGDLDMFIVNNQEQPLFYRNDAGGRDWLRVRVLTKEGRDAVGARVVVTAQKGGKTILSMINTGSNFLSQSEMTAHFGLGKNASTPVFEVRVHWPDTGKDKVLTNVERNQVLIVKPD